MYALGRLWFDWLREDDEYAQTGCCDDPVEGEGKISTGALVPRGVNPIWIHRGVDGSELDGELDGVELKLDVYDIFEVEIGVQFLLQ